MATMEKANKAAEQLAKTTGDAYKTVIDHTVALQERNVKFLRGVFEGTVREIRSQTESNQEVVGELVERAEGSATPSRPFLRNPLTPTWSWYMRRIPTTGRVCGSSRVR